MKSNLKLCCLLLAVSGLWNLARAQGTAFTYQGRLNNSGNPLTGSYDLRFTVYDALGGGNVAGGPVTNSATAVSNGLFTVSLDLGPNVFTGPARWLELSVRTNGNGAFTLLNPRQAIQPTPYAIFANTASNIVNGSAVKSLNNLKDDVTLAAGANVSITPSGNTLTIASTGGAGVWSLNGSSTYYNSGNVGIGTTTPNHHLSIIGGPTWTANGWLGAVELQNASALAWQANGAGQRFGMGHTGGGFFLFRTASNPGTTASPALYDFGVDDSGRIGIGTTAPTSQLDIFGQQDALRITAIQPVLTIRDTSSANARTAIQSVAGGMNLFTESYLSGANAFAYLHLDNSGKVGIGSATPTSKLDVVAQDALSLVGYQPFLTIWDSNAGYTRSRIQGVGGSMNLFTESYLSGANPFAYLHLDNSGNVGIASATPSSKLEVAAQDALGLIGYQPFLTLKDSNAGYARSRMQGVGGDIILETEGYVNGSSPNGFFRFYNSGNVSVGSITIRGGADIAEPFDLSTLETTKGSVMIIDPENPGKLKVSNTPYDQRVAGVVSGANGINPGISLHQEGRLDGAQNVALSGRVYVLADASNGAIRPGDLLTTSDTPGHAMKVTDHARAQGAILGKAMSALQTGKGMVLILVTLQ